jgi:hypothetical protein
MQKVVAVEDPSLPFPGDYPAWIRVHMSGGHVYERRQMHVAGSAQNPMSPAEYERKFVDNASRTLDANRVQELVKRLRDIPRIVNMAEVAPLYA